MSDTPMTDAFWPAFLIRFSDSECSPSARLAFDKEKKKLESELAEAKEQLKIAEDERTEYLRQVKEYERQIAAGELFTPQIIHGFLETKHDRWNPLYMADLVKFAAEQARKDAK